MDRCLVWGLTLSRSRVSMRNVVQGDKPRVLLLVPVRMALTTNDIRFTGAYRPSRSSLVAHGVEVLPVRLLDLVIPGEDGLKKPRWCECADGQYCSNRNVTCRDVSSVAHDGDACEGECEHYRAVHANENEE